MTKTTFFKKSNINTEIWSYYLTLHAYSVATLTQRGLIHIQDLFYLLLLNQGLIYITGAVLTYCRTAYCSSGLQCIELQSR